jgi:crotonobetainyl-CoA:carnitine CoA-transferase CaiB-like acyl-CoA transferase
MLTPVDDADLGPILMHGVMWGMSKSPGEIRFTGRPLGADTDAVLMTELGLSPDYVSTLRDEGVVT